MICTKCGQTVCIARLARGTEYWCKTCGDVPRDAVVKSPVDALKVSMQRIAELEKHLSTVNKAAYDYGYAAATVQHKARIAELESALAESRALRDDLWRALKEKSEVAF